MHKDRKRSIQVYLNYPNSYKSLLMKSQINSNEEEGTSSDEDFLNVDPFQV